MNIHDKVQTWLDQFNFDLQIIDTPTNTATVELAAEALGIQVGQIAKSLVFRIAEDRYVMVVTTGDVKIKSGKLKAVVGAKPKMAKPAEVLQTTGYSVGGVCPFDLPAGITVYLDESLNRYPVVYTAAGSDHSAVGVTMDQLKQITGAEVINVTE